ncbi:hypothetical protein CEQ90_07215 [Lewinellaceae bacterium SD302]|nr:hypothetical protein CEQ90_07215 [Lewinellaceae bacterium SD302]
MILRPLLLIFVFSLSAPLFAQYPTYAPPLRGPLLVTGTFGELRTNHYHAGLDFRAATGTAVYSIADGYVSRVKISEGGYGQAIYVDHPEGYRSVYGHLSALEEELLDTVRARQLSEEKFGVDLRFDSLRFPVRKGQRIGAVGNRGYSFGPHLHFEVRSQINDAALNPLNFGIEVKDTRPPQLRKLKVYERDVNGKVIAEQILSLRSQGKGRYDLQDTLVVNSKRVDFALKAYDRQDAMPNYNGPYGMRLVRDSSPVYAFRFDSIPFEQTLRLNAHVDYAEWTGEESWFHRLHDLPNGQLSYLQTLNYTPPDLSSGVVSPVEISVMDWSGNVAALTFQLRYEAKAVDQSVEPYEFYRIPWNVPSIIEREDLKLSIPAEALYEDLEMKLEISQDSSADILSQVIHLHDRLTPLQKAIGMSLQPNIKIEPKYREKVILTRCTKDGEVISYGGALNETGGVVELPVRTFGTYCLQTDTIPPTIETTGFRNPIRGTRRISFRITDNVGTAGRARGLRYRATLDGEWLLFEYDLKKNRIYHDLTGQVDPNGAIFRLEVWDDRDNKAIFETMLKN